MAVSAATKERYTIPAYLDLETKQARRYEYDDGLVRAMSGGTINHSTLGTNMTTLLSNIVTSKQLNYRPFNSDLKIHIETSNSFVYADGLLVCGDIMTGNADKNAITNPVLVVEVLSKSTERYDRGDKFHKYCSLPSFKEYVLIDQYKAVVDVLYKADASYWKMTTAIGLEDSFYLHTLDATILMKTLYEGTQRLVPPLFRMDLD